MSIQNRLLIIYTIIFSVAFVIFASIVYVLPRNRILAQIDSDLEAIASSVVPGSGPLPASLNELKTASTFVIVANGNGEVLLTSRNLATSGYSDLLDPDADPKERSTSIIRFGDQEAPLRVLTLPLTPSDEDVPPEQVFFLQAARLIETFESFNRMLVTALLIGLAAATISLFMAILLTPSLFRPLEDMAVVARQITRADDLSRRVPDNGRTDEIGDLARAFNQTLERLERLFRAQQRLLADVSHELRTPLTTVRGNLDLMRRMGDGDLESLDVIEDEVKRMTRLVGDLLLLARADSGGLPLELKVIELDNVLFDVYRQMSSLEQKIEMELTAVDQVVVLGDSDRLRQLLQNLIGNAIKYTPAGKVSISLAKEENWAIIEISDTGLGIPAEDLPHIYDRFYRVDKARSRAQGGSGLGLSIAKWVTEAHGGKILVASQIGEGTTFTIRLPIYKTIARESKRKEEDGIKTRPRLRSFRSTLRRGSD